MPPKPKGLKASKRAAPFDPSSAPSEATTPSTETERTYPLDEDCLTLPDLFELRLTVLELLYPFPTDLFISQTDPERLDEARSFLRGILHGCAVLEQYVQQSWYGEEAEKDQEGNRSDEKVEKRREEAGEEKLNALGLGLGGSYSITEGLILYLQAWSLHQLGEIFEDPKEEIKSAALKLGGGGGGPSKKRKIDLNEPRTKIEWLEAAHSKYRLAHDGVSMNYHAEGGEDHLVMCLTNADYIRCKTSLARCYFQNGQEEKGKELAKECGYSGLADRALEDAWAINCDETDCFEAGDAVLAQLRAWAETVSFIESFPQDEREGWELKLVKPSPESDKDLWKLHLSTEVLESEEIEDELERLKESKEGKLEDLVALLRWLKQVVIADVQMVSFIKMEDALESKYRPEEEGEDEEEDDGEDSEVKELPMDAEDVQLVKQASQKAIDTLRQTIESFGELPACFAHPSGKDAQYRKLEETLLISSALVNPSDEEGTAKIEEEIEQVRKEGGLDQEEEEGDVLSKNEDK
ncbi:hypothetical protein JCM5350_007620 [Sporobolomyces pararoseus]